MSILKPMPEPQEPRKQNRWVVEFVGTNIQSWVVQKVNMPSYNIENESWEDVVFELLDPVNPSSNQAVLNDIINKKSTDSFGCSTIKIKMLSPVGECVETWTLNGKYSKIDFSNLDYSSDEFYMINITFKIRVCEIN